MTAVALLVLLTACGGDGPTGVGDGVAGTYTLRTANGAPIPFTISSGGPFKLERMDDAYSLTDGGRWTRVWHERTTSGGSVTTAEYADAGVYARSGTSITLTSPAMGAVSGSVAAGTLSLDAEGRALVFMK